MNESTPNQTRLKCTSQRLMLNGLPVDLLLSISDFLATEDTACLSLCSRRLHDILHAPGKIMLPTGPNKLILLSRLERDLPNRFLCFNCELLHKYDASQDFTPYAEFRTAIPLHCRLLHKYDASQDLTPYADVWRAISLHSIRQCSASAVLSLMSFSIWTGVDQVMYRLYFYHVQLVMKRLFHGANYGISVDELAHVEVGPYRLEDIEFAKTSLISYDAHICRETPSLLLRIQEVLYGPSITSNGPRSRQRIDTNNYPRRFTGVFDICPHAWIQKPFERTSDWVICTNTSTIIEEAISNFHSQACDIDFLAQHVQPVQEKTDQALIITKWIDLGAGSSPDDSRWAKHSSAIGDESGPVLERSSPRIRFETTSPMPLAALGARNLYYLRNRRYEHSMHRSALKDAWYLAGQEVKEQLTERLEEQRASIIPKYRRVA